MSGGQEKLSREGRQGLPRLMVRERVKLYQAEDPREAPLQRQLRMKVLPQPDDTTCGPTCLHAVYRYWRKPLPLQRVIREVTPLPGGGTLAVWLANHALQRGFDATIYTYNLHVFDPSWFVNGIDIASRLEEQRHVKSSKKLKMATTAYLKFLELGGQLRFQKLNSALIRRYIGRGTPILTGLSSTYLYNCARELGDEYDDVRGEPAGHFVVICGYNQEKREVMIADPLADNPRFRSQYYSVGMDRLIGAILLGVITYDANLLILTPSKSRERE